MSRQTSVCCDLCGVEIPQYDLKNNSAQIRLNSPGEYRGIGGQRIDLCLECYAKFVKFIESGGNAE